MKTCVGLHFPSTKGKLSLEDLTAHAEVTGSGGQAGDGRGEQGTDRQGYVSKLVISHTQPFCAPHFPAYLPFIATP